MSVCFRDNSEAFMSCSSRPESVQSDERNAAMVIFPDGTIKKIAAEKVQKMSNHMADVTLDFAENEKFIHGQFFLLPPKINEFQELYENRKRRKKKQSR
jgi:hypothetical protein